MPNYCELPLWGSFFEPMNTVSNLAFMVAAYFLWRLSQEAHGVGETKLRTQLRTLTFLLVAIGTGSGLWHFWASPLTLILDVLPIQAFLIISLWFLLEQHQVGLKSRLSLSAGFLLFTMVAPAIASLFVPVGAGGGYLAALLFAFVVNIWLFTQNSRQAWYFLLTLIIFGFSLSFRQFDVMVCSLTGSIGFHYLWHALNAIVLYRFANLLMLKSGHYIDNKQAEKL